MTQLITLLTQLEPNEGIAQIYACIYQKRC